MSAPAHGPLWLASRSPRRRRLLEEAGVRVSVRPADIDDGRLVPGRVDPAAWVTSLAYLKARWVLDALTGAAGDGVVLGADTVCVCDGRIMGQPVDAAAAGAMLRVLRGRAHVTLTGVCLLPRTAPGRWLFADAATVTWGALDDDVIDAYVASGAWRGKAGAYNLADRQAAGWPVTCAGDPATVMGLPMRRLETWLARVRASAAERHE